MKTFWHLKNSIIASTSSDSRCPNVTYSPSESPQPERSRQQSEILKGIRNYKTVSASILLPLLPWR